MLRIEARPSPNHNARPAGAIVNTIVLHNTAGASELGDIEWCQKDKAALSALWRSMDPAKRPKKPWSPVSYHDIVGRKGKLYQLVETTRRAWHAGASSFDGRANCNDFALGIAFANRNDGEEGHTAEQLQAAADLCAARMQQHPAITLERITTHYIVSPGRKDDPRPPFALSLFLSMVAERMACPLIIGTQA